MKTKIIYMNLLATGLSVCFLSGCGKIRSTPPPELPTALVILAGNHSNSKKQDMNIQSKVTQVYEGFGTIRVIGIDGSPSVIRDAEGHIPGYIDDETVKKSKRYYKSNKTYWKNNILTPQVEAFLPALTIPADDPEVDTLASLCVAANELNSMEATMGKEIKKEIIIYDTGLCTSGALNLLNTDYFRFVKCGLKIQQDAEIKEEVDRFINHLYDQAELPNLEGVTVTWYGLGNVDLPQPPLSNLDIVNLQYIWGEILRKSKAVPSQAGGSDSEYGMFVSVNADSTIACEQTVTPIIFWEGVGGIVNKETSPEAAYESTSVGYENTSYEEPPKFTEEKLGFQPESAEYYAEEEAQNILRPYASNLINYPAMQVLLVGTTADPNQNGGGKELSLERAQTVKDTLVSLGVPAGRIDIIGKGATSPWYKDEWTSGEFDRSIAKENRAVYILPADSEMAREMLAESQTGPH